VADYILGHQTHHVQRIRTPESEALCFTASHLININHFYAKFGKDQGHFFVNVKSQFIRLNFGK